MGLIGPLNCSTAATAACKMCRGRSSCDEVSGYINRPSRIGPLGLGFALRAEGPSDHAFPQLSSNLVIWLAIGHYTLLQPGAEPAQYPRPH